MSKKKRYLVVGCVAGGASAAARIRRLDAFADVIAFEKGPHASFSNCCLPYHLGGVVPTAEKLLVMDKDDLINQYNLDVRTEHEVVKIDRKKKEVLVKDLKANKEYKEKYDYLVLSPGAKAIRPASIGGVNDEHVFSVKNVVDIVALKSYIEKNKVKDIAVIGGGFIGLEVAENLREAKYNVSLVEAQNQIMLPFDYDMAQILHKEMYDKGVHMYLEESLKNIHKDEIELASGKRIKAQAVVMAIGVSPESSLAREAGLELNQRGAIVVNHHYQTSDPSIYAVGDVIQVTHQITRKKTALPLAGPAQRQARAAADHMFGRTYKNTGVIGSACIKLFDYNAARTGLNEKECIANDIDYDYSLVIPKDKVGLMPNANPIIFKLIFAKPSGEILGAQAIGKGNVDKRIDVIAAMITMKADLDDLKELELCYAPPFSTAKDPINMAALVGLNLLNGEYKQIRIPEMRKYIEEGKAVILDVREQWEYDEGHIKNALHIPFSQFRNRLDEIPKNKMVIVHCLSSQRSYYVVKDLILRGYDNIYNMAGSILGLCLYEYFNDKTKNREPLTTNYKLGLN